MNLYVEIFLGFVFVSISVHALHLTFFSGVKEVQRDVSPLNSTFIISLALAVAVVVLIAFIILGKSDLAISSNIGQVGDFIGGLLNPVLSFLALLVLLRTTLIQTNEAKKTTAFMATQQGIMEREKFENTFFQLVGRLDDYAEVLFRSETDRSKRYAYQLRQKLVKKRDEFDLMSWKAGVDASAEYVRGIIAGDFDRLNGFARKASHCLYFIDGSGITPDEKKFYYNYFIEVFHQYEYSLFLTIIFLRSPNSVRIVKGNNLANTLRSDSLCSVHVYNLFGADDTSSVYPLLTHPEGMRRTESSEPS